jgi:glutamate 5-kinase
VSQPTAGTVVVKVGTSSITDDDGAIDRSAVAKVCGDIADLRALGHDVVLVSSGAIAAGLPALGMTARRRPRDAQTLQAVSAVGQARLMEVYHRALGDLGVVPGQVLLAPLDFTVRRQYLHARSTLERLLELGVLPIVNENDAVADEEIRYGDNDRIAALVAQLVGASTLVLLTDAAGLFTSDPRLDEEASLIEEVIELDRDLEAAAGGSGSNRGSGGMATKVAAAKIAAWSGVRTVIAAADRPRVLADALAGVAGVGTVVQPHRHAIGARKVWIAFAVGSSGRVHVDDGARRALTERNSSLLAVGVTKVEGDFDAGDAVEVVDPDGRIIAKGLVRVDADALRSPGPDVPGLVIHRDDLVVDLPG